MKRIFTIILIFVLIFSLSSCSSKPIETEPENIVQEENIEEIIKEVPKKVEVKAGVFWYDFSDAYLSTVRDALNAELDALGIKYTNYDAASTQATQNDQIDSAIANGADLLIVNIVDTAAIDAAQAIVNNADAADIPVIFFNREVADEVINSYENACFVGIRAAEAGEVQGIMAGEYIVDNYDAIDLNKDGYISYIMMAGEVHERIHNVKEPIDYCNKELTAAGKPELNYYDANNTDKYQLATWSKTTAFDCMETALSTNPMDGDAPIEVIFANNDDMALGCILALNNAGWNTGDDQFIPVFGMEYNAEAQAAIEAGMMTGSIQQSASGMAETISALVENVMNNEHIFDGAVDVFNVDEGSAKIRVPYEIKI